MTRPTTRLRRRWAADDGAVSVELVIAVPVVMFMLLMVVQYGVWLHATHVADTAATHALAATRVDDGSVGGGRDQADHVLAELGTGAFQVERVRVHRDATTASVHITGTARAVVPGMHLPVDVRASGPVERVTSP